MKYPKDTPVDEPVAKPKQAKAKTYPDSVPVDEPVKKMASGGVTRADGCISKGHTKGRMV
jgi:hypothetical protein